MSKKTKTVVGADPADLLLAEVREMIADLPPQFRQHVEQAAALMRETVAVAMRAQNAAPSLAMILVGLEVIVNETSKQTRGALQ